MNWNNNPYEPANTGLNAAAQGKCNEVQLTGTTTISSTAGQAVSLGYIGGDVAKSIQKLQMPSIADHIETRIARLEGEVKHLREIKAKLAKPGGVLEVSLGDMRFLLNY